VWRREALLLPAEATTDKAATGVAVADEAAAGEAVVGEAAAGEATVGEAAAGEVAVGETGGGWSGGWFPQPNGPVAGCFR